MMTDDEVQGAIETLTELTKDGELHWRKSSADGGLRTDELDGFSITLTEMASKSFEFVMDDDKRERAAYIGAAGDVDYSVQMKLYQLYMIASAGAGSDEKQSFDEAVAKKRARR
jgi:hypothetical protein